MARYLTWLIVIILIIVVVCIVFAVVWGNQNEGDGRDVFVRNRVIENNRRRRRGAGGIVADVGVVDGAAEESCLSTDSMFPDDDFGDLEDEVGLDRAAARKLAAAKARGAPMTQVASAPTNLQLTTEVAGTQGPEGPPGQNGSGGRVDLGIITYSGIFLGLPAPKRIVLGFGATSSALLPLSKKITTLDNTIADTQNGYVETQRYYKMPEEIERERVEEERVAKLMEDEEQLIGSFWVNPTVNTLHLSSLRGSAISNDLIAVPGTLLHLQIALAATGSPKFIPIGPPVAITLSSATGLTCFGAPAMLQDVPISPGTMVALFASTSSHVRGSLHIGAALAYF